MAAEHRVCDDNHEEQDGQGDGGEKRQRRKRQTCSSNSGCGSIGWMYRKETNTTNTSLSDYGSRLTVTFKKLRPKNVLSTFS